MIKLLLFNLILSSLFLLTSCGGGASSSENESSSGSGEDSVDANSETGLPNDINGLLLLDTWGSYSSGNKLGIHTIEFNNGNVIFNKKLSTGNTGVNPFAHDRSTITYSEPCGGNLNHRIKTMNSNGVSSSPVTNCSSEDYKYFGSYEIAKYSPDKSKIAIQVTTGRENYRSTYTTKIFDAISGNELNSFKHYYSPEWHPDGRLLLSATFANDNKGIFITDSSLSENLIRIDHGAINQTITSLDLNLSADKLIFEMSGRVWMMNVDANSSLNNLKEIVYEGANIVSPTWSPDGKYIAYLSYIDGLAERKITFWHVASNTSYIFDTKTIFPLDSYGFHWMTPRNPLSWVK